MRYFKCIVKRYWIVIEIVLYKQTIYLLLLRTVSTKYKDFYTRLGPHKKVDLCRICKDGGKHAFFRDNYH